MTITVFVLLVETPDDFGEDEESFEFDWIVSNTPDQDSEKQMPQPGVLSFTPYLVHFLFEFQSYSYLRKYKLTCAIATLFYLTYTMKPVLEDIY